METSLTFLYFQEIFPKSNQISLNNLMNKNNKLHEK